MPKQGCRWRCKYSRVEEPWGGLPAGGTGWVSVAPESPIKHMKVTERQISIQSPQKPGRYWSWGGLPCEVVSCLS